MDFDDLRSFAKNNQEKETQNQEASNPNINISKQQAQDLFEKYKNYSEGDLTQEIARLIFSQKQNGTFNKTQLLLNINSFSAFIPAQKVAELKELIEQIDSQN